MHTDMSSYSQHRIHQQPGFLTTLPAHCFAYATMHLDSIGKITNHALAIVLVCDIFMFFSSWSVSILPYFGLNTVFISFLCCAQTVLVFLIVNNNRISALSFLSPTEFMVGVALGTTIGAGVLALVLSSAYRHLSNCKLSHGGSASPHKNHTLLAVSEQEDSDVYQFVCEQHKGAMTAVWFWGGLVFWFNFCICLLLAMGKQELTGVQSQYEHIGGSESSNHVQSSSRIVQDYEEQFRRSQAGFPAGQMMQQQQAPAFAGDYATIPEIRTDLNNNTQTNPSATIRQV